MKILKGAARSQVLWTTRKLVQMFKDGEVNFDIDIQRGYVWKDNDKRSALIRSLILDRPVPPLYFNKIEDAFEGEDGKQRTLTIIKFLQDEFELSGLEAFKVINDDGELEELDMNGLKYSELPDCFQDAIKDYGFTIEFTDNASQEEVADNFYNLNNGQSMNAATINRVKAKSKDQIIRLGKHELFAEALTKVAMDGHVNDDLVAKAHAVLKEEDPSMNAAWVRKYMRNADITSDDEVFLGEIFDRIKAVHDLIEDKKIAKRIYTRTHMISIVPMIKQSLDDGLSDQQTMEWIVTFFAGSRSATISSEYNRAAGTGSGKSSNVRIRLNEVAKSYQNYFKKGLIAA